MNEEKEREKESIETEREFRRRRRRIGFLIMSSIHKRIHLVSVKIPFTI